MSRFDTRYFDRAVLWRYRAGWAGLTTERSTPATLRDRSGVIRTAGPGVLRTTWEDGRLYALVEPAGENLVPLTSRTFEAGWAVTGGAQVTVTQGQTIPGYSPTGGATRIRTVGGTDFGKWARSLGPRNVAGPESYSVVVQNIGAHPVVLSALSALPSASIAPGETRRATIAAEHVEAGGTRLIRFAAMDAAHDLDFVAYAPQVELSPVVTSYIPEATRDRDLVSVGYHHAPGSLAVLTAGREAGLGQVGQAHEWQIGASTDLDARALRVRRDGGSETLRLWLGSGDARVESAVPAVPMGAEYLRLALLDVQGTEARVRLMQRHREGSGPWIDASGSWSAWLDVSELLASGWQSPHLTIGNVREGTRAGRLQLSDMLVLDGREVSVAALTWDRMREWLP